MNSQKEVITLRQAVINDIPSLVALRKLLLSSGSGHYVAKSIEEDIAWQKSYIQWLHEHINKKDKILVLTAVSNSVHIVGCAISIIDERVPFNGCLNGKMGWVQTVVVHPDFRKKGIAKEMMEYIFSWLQEQGVEKLAIQPTDMAKKWYQKSGFVDTNEPLLIKTL